jgi:subtilisin family serine protease
MQQSVVARRAFKAIIFSLIFTVLGTLWVVVSAHAETIMVYPGEYVVETDPNTVSTQSVAVAASASVEKDLGENTHLLKRVPAPGSESIESVSGAAVPYNPMDTYCIDLVKQHIVKSCSPNYQVHTTETSNDPKLPELWGMSAANGIDAPSAWNVSTGSNDVVVAVIDTGADYNHPDLAANIWTNPGEIAGNGIDEDGDGVVDDVHGFNAVANNGNPMDDNEHGTHVSGTIGARGNNGVGVVGVNWNVKIMPLKFLGADGSGSLSAAVQAINYMVMMKNRGVNIRVANNSWGGGGYSDALYHAIARARDAGIIFVAAAGNESNNNDGNPSYPADYDLPNVVSVAAVDQNRNLAYFSNFGVNSVDIAAPGVDILSTTPNNTYQKFSGTSMATPHVTGALALLLANEPDLTYEQAIQRLYDSGLDVPALHDVIRTGRMVNAGRLLNNILSPLPTPTPTPLPCSYSAEKIDWAPDTAADTAAVVQQSDEFNFYQLTLPFVFPYQGQQVTSVFISPNGVVYTQAAPEGMDYENGASAPINSIAALQTDLVASADPYGVRVYADSDHATIFWTAKHYSRRALGDIDIHLSLYADGRIEEFLSFGDSDIQTYVAARSTIGLSGPTADSAYTYAYDDASVITNGLAIRYTGVCAQSAENAKVQGISLSGVDRKGHLTHHAKAGKEAVFSFSGEGNGSISINASWNGRACTQTGQVTLSNGLATVSTRIPKVPAGFKLLRITSQGAKAAIQVDGPPAEPGKNTNVRRVRVRQFNKICAALLSNLTPK